jgi:hypothetical protein
MKALITMLVMLVSLASQAVAQTAEAQSAEAPAAPGLLERAGATVTLRLGLWSSTRELDSDGPLGAGMLWGKVTRPVTPHISFFVEGWAALRGPFSDGDARGELREAFVTVTSGPLELRAGRQVIAWGRADGINPTDNLTGQDLTLLAPDDSDRRLGATAFRATYAHRDVTATVIWLPEFRSHRVPLPALAGDLASSESRWEPEQMAVRVEQTGRAIDWSVSAFNGRDLNPDLGVRGGSEATQLTLTHHRIRIIGADATGNIGRYGLRAEVAYNRTDDGTGARPFVKNPFLFVVVGGDRTFHEHLNVNVQYLFRFVTHFTRSDLRDATFANVVAVEQAAFSNQARRTQHGASTRVSHKWLHDTLEAELAAAGYAAPHGMTFRPKVTYAVTDRMKVLVGGEFYRGDPESVFGILRDNSGAYVEVRWSF